MWLVYLCSRQPVYHFYAFLELEEEIYKNLTGIPHAHVYRRSEIPPQYHYMNNRRIPPIVLEPEEHYWVAYNNSNGTGKNEPVTFITSFQQWLC